MQWESIVDEYGEALFRVAFRVLHNVHDAEDVTQEVLLEALRMPEDPDFGMLRRMTTFRAIDMLRRRTAAEPVDLDNCEKQALSPQQAITAREEIQILQQAIARLPRQQARCFWLRYVDGLTNQQIAASAGISESAVSTALNKARQRLRLALQPNMENRNETT